MLRLISCCVLVLAAARCAAAPAAVGADETQAAGGHVVRALFTSAVVDREPVDSILTLGSGESQVYCYTELRGFAGQRVTHRWEYDGRVMAEVTFVVDGWRWRVWSRKTMRPDWHGQWQVSIVDQQGRVLLQRQLTYQSAQGLAPVLTAGGH